MFLAMAEIWRYQDRLAAGLLLAKRPRAELDDVLRHGSAGSGRGDIRYDERDARLLDYGLDHVKTGATFASVLASAGITGLGDGTLLGAGVTGSLRGPGMGLSGLEDSQLSGLDSGLLTSASAGLNGGRSDVLARQDVPGVPPGVQPLPSSTLFLEGLPKDCTRREVAHIFRPFRGYKEVRIAKKDRKGAEGEKREKFFLCFVEFEDASAAAKALEALHGYKLDEHEPDSEPLRLQFARLCAPRVGRPFSVRRHRRR